MVLEMLTGREAVRPHVHEGCQRDLCMKDMTL